MKRGVFLLLILVLSSFVLADCDEFDTFMINSIANGSQFIEMDSSELNFSIQELKAAFDKVNSTKLENYYLAMNDFIDENYYDCKVQNPDNVFLQGNLKMYQQVCSRYNYQNKLELNEQIIIGYCHKLDESSPKIKEDKQDTDDIVNITEEKIKETSNDQITKNWIYENFDFIINKLPLDTPRNNFYLFIAIVVVLVFYVFRK